MTGTKTVDPEVATQINAASRCPATGGDHVLDGFPPGQAMVHRVRCVKCGGVWVLLPAKGGQVTVRFEGIQTT